MKFETKETDLKGVFTDMMKSSSSLQGDLGRMDIKSKAASGTGELEEAAIDQLTQNVHKIFEGNETKAALYLRAIGQGPSIKLKEMQPTDATQHGKGDLLLAAGSEKDSVVFDLAAKTVTVIYHQHQKYQPTQAELNKGGQYYTHDFSHATGIDLGKFIMCATLDFERDLVTYSITPEISD